MTQALYYAPSYERLAEGISDAAPDLDVVLLQADGSLQHHGRTVSLADCSPEWFWIHAELMGNKALLPEYFDLIRQCESASWLHTINTGLDLLPYEQVFGQGVTITNNHAQAIAIAEYVMGHVMAHYQQHALLQKQQQDGKWKYTRFRELGNTRWLIIGFGHIGQEVAVRARAFGARIDAVRRQDDNAGLARDVWHLEDLSEVLPLADVVVLACNLNDSTRNLVDAGFLAAMQDDAVLVNIARGDLVDEGALLLALESGKLARAILDVFRQEPLSAASPLWSHPAVTLTPHCSNAGSGMLARSDELFLENLRRRVADAPLLNQVGAGEFA